MKMSFISEAVESCRETRFQIFFQFQNIINDIFQITQSQVFTQLFYIKDVSCLRPVNEMLGAT